MKRLLAVLLFCPVLQAQTPSTPSVHIEDTPVAVMVMSGAAPPVFVSYMIHPGPKIEAELRGCSGVSVVSADDAGFIVTPKSPRGAEVRSKQGSVIFTTKARSEKSIAKDVCSYIASHS